MGSVTGISHIEYILPIASFVRNRSQISTREIFEVVKKEAIERERQKAISAGKFWIDYEKRIRIKPHFLQGITNSLILAMKKWKLLDNPTSEGTFPVCESLKTLGKIDITKQDGLLQAKMLLYDCIIRSGKEIPFDPSNFLIAIRNNSVSVVKAVVRKNGEEEIEDRSIPYCEGRAYNDSYFVRTRLNTNFRSFDVMRDWGYYLGLLNEYNSVPINVDPTKKVLYPKYEVYLARTICTLDEIVMTIRHIRKIRTLLTTNDIAKVLGITNYAAVCVVYNLKSFGLVSYKEGKIIPESSLGKLSDSSDKELCQHVVERIKPGESILVSDAPLNRGVFAEPPELLDIDLKHLFVMTTTSWEMEDFERTLREAYIKLTKGRSGRYTWILLVRKEVCRKLRIHDDEFDKYLGNLYELRPGVIELSKAAGDVTSRMLRKFDKPFKFKEKLYRMVMIGGRQNE